MTRDEADHMARQYMRAAETVVAVCYGQMKPSTRKLAAHYLRLAYECLAETDAQEAPPARPAAPALCVTRSAGAAPLRALHEAGEDCA